MNEESLQKYRNSIRLLLILYFFSEPLEDLSSDERARVFRSEVKLQKLDFLVRYPSYLCYELLAIMKEDSSVDRNKVRKIVKEIFDNEEPKINTQEMRRFIFGAHEDLNEILAFLHSHRFIHFSSETRVDGKKHKKEYYIFKSTIDKINKALNELESLTWYKQKCEILMEFFGDLKGTELKDRQYKIDEYKDTPIGDFIEDIEDKAKKEYYKEFNVEL